MPIAAADFGRETKNRVPPVFVENAVFQVGPDFGRAKMTKMDFQPPIRCVTSVLNSANNIS